MTTATVRTTPKRGRSGSRTRGLARRLFMLFALPIILVALWWFGSAGSTNYLNPPLSTIMAEFWPTWFGGDSFADTRFAQDVLPSVVRMLTGYGIALVFGIALGVLIGTNRRCVRSSNPCSSSSAPSRRPCWFRCSCSSWASVLRCGSR